MLFTVSKFVTSFEAIQPSAQGMVDMPHVGTV